MTDWERYVAALRVHEQGHLDLADAAARRLSQALQEVIATDCAAVQAAADALGRAEQQALARAQADYDRDTDHGRTQGAVL